MRSFCLITRHGQRCRKAAKRRVLRPANCRILSTDKKGKGNTAKRNSRVTTKDDNVNAHHGRIKAAKKLQRLEKSHERNPTLASRISAHHQSDREILTRISGNTNDSSDYGKANSPK
ncbi:hypothetical protein PCASD_11198 [Puccinia coronata f. sp. avenae]|uniref:Uncharacterized protein n=1 Tax=Puccinia coronata f. sp. avenae TaxID=200324 RepID=A0A2N5UFF4_9BASI|nr:hypothetical protein PCASD_11198 [Puccinia coronata f. sp. avenae]